MNLQERHPFDADQVKQVIVKIAPAEGGLVNNREMPDICLQHMVAVMLLDKTASFRSAHDKARMQDPAVRQQRAKVRHVPSTETRLPFLSSPGNTSVALPMVPAGSTTMCGNSRSRSLVILPRVNGCPVRTVILPQKACTTHTRRQLGE